MRRGSILPEIDRTVKLRLLFRLAFMTVLIDEPRWPAHGTLWAHLVSDESLEELHEFANALGLPSRAFDLDHYDIPASRHLEFVNAGAILVSNRELVKRLKLSGLRVTQRERRERKMRSGSGSQISS